MLWLLPWLSLSVQAAPAVDGGAQVSATARVGTHGCMSTPTDCAWLDFNDAAVVSPWVSARPNDQVSARAALDLRLHGPASGHGLSASTKQQPWSLRMRDAWVSSRSEHTDLKVGIQRIAWGEAQGISVVDTINPLNLEDPTRLDQRLSVLAASFTAHTETLAFTAVAVPYFVPAALPAVDVDLMTDGSDLFDDRFIGDDTIQLGEVESRPDVPRDGLSDTAVAARLRWTPSFGDFGVSWHAGRDSLPQVAGDVTLIGYQTKANRVDVGVPLAYPRQHTYGLTARSALPADITVWAEAALTMPQRTVAQPRANQLSALANLGIIEDVPDPIPETETQDGEPVTRWVIGLDRPLGPVRVVGQWLHGLFTERKQADLKDYALVGIRWTITPTIRLDGTTATDMDGHLTDVGITILHGDNAEITIATTQIRGSDESTLSGLKAASNVRTQVSMQF